MLDHILTGQVAPLGPRSAPSAIAKRPISARVFLGREGLSGDAQGDRKHHGGADKAVHHYPFDHYARWADAIGKHDLLEGPGAFGENLSTRGMTEEQAAIGDTFKLGEAVVQISQGRQPCWKLNARFDVPDMALQVQRSGMTGWYYRVIEEGAIEAGDQLHLVDRLSPDWTIRRAWRTLYVDTMNLDELAEMAALEHLPDTWRGHAKRRLETRQVEDWNKRLRGD
jgi:MOSC domain-containing protein YiiM